MTQLLSPTPAKQETLTAVAAGSGIGLRTWIVALFLTGLAGWWVRQADIVVVACQITESVPAIPGLAALALLLAVNPLLRRIPWARPFSRGELLAIFLFV